MKLKQSTARYFTWMDNSKTVLYFRLLPEEYRVEVWSFGKWRVCGWTEADLPSESKNGKEVTEAEVMLEML